MKTSLKAMLAITAVCGSLRVQAGNPTPAARFQAGISTGSGLLLGETKVHKPGISGGCFLNLRINRSLAAELQYDRILYRSGTSDQTGYYLSGYTINTRIKENFQVNTNSSQITAMLGAQILKTHVHTIPVSMKVSAGIGMAHYFATAHYTDMLDSFGSGSPNPVYRTALTETYEGTHYQIPLGLTLSVKPWQHVGVDFHCRYQFARTDDIDLLNNPVWTNRNFDHTLLLQARIGYWF